jgi:hypothetical protein
LLSETAGQEFKCDSGECILDHESDSNSSVDNYALDVLMHDHDNDEVDNGIRDSTVKHTQVKLWGKGQFNKMVLNTQ